MGLKDETVTIKNDQVYSSYYARACKIVPDSRLVAISLQIPDNFGGQIMRELNPSESILWGYKNNKITWDEYEKQYTEQILNKLNPVEVYERLKGKVMLCYCGKGKHCHRQIVMRWLSKNIGKDFTDNEI